MNNIEESSDKSIKYAYNAQNRLIYCEVTDRSAKEYSQTTYSYDAFGSLTAATDLGYLGKQHDPTSTLYNYGYRDYKPQTARFTTVDPIRDGSNWFSYCNGDPVNFVDLWGLELGHRTTHNRMSDSAWGNDKTGNGVENQTLSYTGCAITEESNVISSATGKVVTPKIINDNKENFTPDTDLLNMQKVAQDNGLLFDYWTSEKQGNLGKKIKEISNSNKTVYVSAQVKYNAAGNLHWVGVEAVETRANGKIYIKIEPSSVHDVEKINRSRNTWKLDNNGNMWIETGDINKIYTYTKNK